MSFSSTDNSRPTRQSFAPATRFFLWGQAIFYLFAAAEIAVRPAGLTANHGICYYELFKNTTPLYLCGLISAGWLNFQAIRLIPTTDPLSRSVMTTFKWMGLCLIGMICCPIMLGRVLGYIHVTFGSCLFLLQLGLAVRIFLGSRSVGSALLLILQFCAGLVCIFSLAHWLTYQIEGQMVFQFAFGLLMLRYLYRPTPKGVGY